MVLSVNKLSVRYGDKIAVQNLSFYLGEGKVIGLLGANGAGNLRVLQRF